MVLVNTCIHWFPYITQQIFAMWEVIVRRLIQMPYQFEEQLDVANYLFIL